MFTIVICTFNKAYSLANTLDSIVAQDYSEYEVLVVDNNSNDETKNIIAKKQILFRKKGINLIYIFEKIQGLSSARNTGSKNANFNYLIYVDDDCVLISNLLLEYSRALSTFTNCVIAGGSITPRWGNNHSPKWLKPNFYWLFGEMKYIGDNKPRLDRKKETIKDRKSV